MSSYNLHEKECQSPVVPLKRKVLILWVKGDPHSGNKEDQTSKTKAKFNKFLYLPVIRPVIQVAPRQFSNFLNQNFFNESSLPAKSIFTWSSRHVYIPTFLPLLKALPLEGHYSSLPISPSQA